MPLYVRRFLLVLSLFAALLPSLSQAVLPVPAAPQIDVGSYLLMDFNSGLLLAEHNIDKRLEPASLTKMMTAYIVYNELANGSLSPDDVTLISEKAWRMGGSRMFIEVGNRVRIDDLVRGLIVQSGNDASVALAEAVAGSEQLFADYMNNYAEKLGMNNSHFTNSTGLPDEQHYSTARDMGLLAQALIRDFPEDYKLYAEREYTYNDIRQYNRNKLLWRDKSVDGIKTGYTQSAGYCLVASALRDDMRIISVVLGARSEKSRSSESQSLLNYGFRFYKTQRIYDKNQVLDSPRIWGGEIENLPLGLAEDLYVTVPRALRGKLKTTLDFSDDIVAPVVTGQLFGTLKILSGDEVIAERPLVALESIGEGGLFRRAMDAILRYFR